MTTTAAPEHEKARITEAEVGAGQAGQQHEARNKAARIPELGGVRSSRILSDKQIGDVARICHEANRAFCTINGDNSQLPWDEALDWQKQSAIEGVRFFLANPYSDSRDMHDKWMELKLRSGWRYGAVKDPELKTHPCLLPHHALPEHERLKHDLFRAVIEGYTRGLSGR